MSYDLAFWRWPVFDDEDDAQAQLGTLTPARTASGRVDERALRDVVWSSFRADGGRLDRRGPGAPALLVPFTFREVADGFTASPLEAKIEGNTILGRGFELTVMDGDRLGYLTGAWSLAEDPRRITLTRIESVLLKLGACIHDPQSDRSTLKIRLREDWLAKIRREERERQPPTARPWQPGEPVRHAKFGDGEVLRSDGDKVVVRFEAGERTLLGRALERVG